MVVNGGMEIRSVGVVGAGQMGSGIAQLAAVNGLGVWLHDSDAAAIYKAQESISSRIQSLVAKGHLTKVLIRVYHHCFSIPLCLMIIVGCGFLIVSIN